MEPPRLLAARSEVAYTEVLAEALPDEPEAVSAAEQGRLTAASRRTAIERERHAWCCIRADAELLLDQLAAVQWTVNAADARTLGRALERVVRRPAPRQPTPPPGSLSKRAVPVAAVEPVGNRGP